MNRKICIVTPCLKGPVNNGGIGTAVYYLAKHITRNLECDLDILFTGPLLNGSCSEWIEFYRSDAEAALYFLEQVQTGEMPPMLDSYWINERSLKVHLWLKDRHYDQIHFQDYDANGFIPIQAKRAGQGYQKTLLTCSLHSSFEWMQTGNSIFPQKTFEEMVHVYMEHYCAAHADIVISPSDYMLRWYADRGYSVNNGVVVQNLFDPQAEKKNTPKKIEEICFFGRLETRKGLEDFVQAIKKLSIEFGESFPKVNFLGRQGLMTSGMLPCEYIRAELEGTDISYEIDSSKDAFQAIDYLKRGDILAVVASKSDNLPYVVVECLQNGIPIMASNVGGIPELIKSQEHLFAPGQNGLGKKLGEMLSHGWTPVESGYDPDKSRAQWTEILSLSTAPVPAARYTPEDVTICIPYFNYPDYLPQLLDSLDQQTVRGFKIIVINDGSTKEDANRIFEELQDSYSSQYCRFLARENKGISYTRNEAARLAETSLLIFMDSDNLAMPDMVEKMVQGINYSGVDCLTCYAEFFEEGNEERVKAIYPPLGPCLQAGLYYNIYGDANLIIKKKSFEKTGGFDVDRSASFEDWEFLARFSLSGMVQDVIPEILFRYRITSAGFSRNTGRYGNFNRIIKTYSKFLPDWAGQLVYHTYTSVRPDLLLASSPHNSDLAVKRQCIFSIGKWIVIDHPNPLAPTLLSIRIPSLLHSILIAISGESSVSSNYRSWRCHLSSECGRSYFSMKIGSLFSKKLIAIRALLDAAAVRKSTLFDENWYYSRYHDVASAKMDAAIHYAECGWREGRDPGPHFSTSGYLGSRPDVRLSGMNPLLHFDRCGRHEMKSCGIHKGIIINTPNKGVSRSEKSSGGL
jgi:glycosyltransferase involved in cell wall biosynthesis